MAIGVSAEKLEVKREEEHREGGENKREEKRAIVLN